jgi:hypothetical protein
MPDIGNPSCRGDLDDRASPRRRRYFDAPDFRPDLATDPLDAPPPIG